MENETELVPSKDFLSYFSERYDYPTNERMFEFGINGVRSGGILLNYISTVFLNGYINYAKPVAAYVMNKYGELDSEINAEVQISLSPDNTGGERVWANFRNPTKRQVFEALVSNGNNSNTDLSLFRDALMILVKIDEDEDFWVYFYFDYGNSECSIGLFEEKDPDKAIKAFKEYVAYVDSWNTTDPHNSPTPIPMSFFASGWFSF